MVILGTPKNLDKYIMLSFKMGNHMHELGFPPKYKDLNGLWFVKNEEFLKVFNREKIL